MHGDDVPARGRVSRGVAARSMNSVPLVTTVSPTSRPLRTSTRPLVVAPTSIGGRRRSSARAAPPRRAPGAFVDDGVLRHGRHQPVVARDDAEGREHLGQQLAVGIVDLGAHRQAARVGIERRRHIVEPGVEDAAGVGQHGDLDRRRRPSSWAHPISRTLAISHTVERSPTVKTGSLAPTLMYWPRPTLRWMIVPAIGAGTIASAPMRSALLELARSPRRSGRGCAAGCARRRARFRPSAGRPARRTRSDCACSRSFSAPPRIASSSRWRFSPVCASASRDLALSTPATAVMRSFWPCTNSLASIANRGAPRSTSIAGPGDQAADPAGVGREDRRGGVLVDRDLAVGRALVAERDLAHRREPEARPLRLARPEGAVGLARHFLRPRHGVARTAVDDPEAGDDRGGGHDSAAREPQAIAPEAGGRSRWGLGLHANADPFAVSIE